MYNYLDLFAGAGGLSEGFDRYDFQALLHIEMEKSACDTLCTRIAYTYLKKHNQLNIYEDYISNKITQEVFYSYIPFELLDKVYNVTLSQDNMAIVKDRIAQAIKKHGSLDILLGGPPCQTYSVVGRSVQKDKVHNDARNYLFNLYVSILKEFKPKIFVFENVTGLLSAKNQDNELYIDLITKAFKDAGYIFDKKILNARSFGVLQNRRRVIIIGWLKELDFSYPQFSDNVDITHLVKELLIDLPLPKVDKYTTDNIPTYLSSFKIREPNDILTQHYTRNINTRDQEIYKYAISLWNENQKRLSYNELPDHLITHKNKSSFTDRFKVLASDLTYTQTILAHLSKDGHYYIHPDIEQSRSITIREAARVQSFPDNYFFEGTMTQAFKQIGNAVPPLMSQEIAKKIKEQLDATNTKRI